MNLMRLLLEPKFYPAWDRSILAMYYHGARLGYRFMYACGTYVTDDFGNSIASNDPARIAIYRELYPLHWISSPDSIWVNHMES